MRRTQFSVVISKWRIVVIPLNRSSVRSIKFLISFRRNSCECSTHTSETDFHTKPERQTQHKPKQQTKEAKTLSPFCAPNCVFQLKEEEEKKNRRRQVNEIANTISIHSHTSTHSNANYQVEKDSLYICTSLLFYWTALGQQKTNVSYATTRKIHTIVSFARSLRPYAADRLRRRRPIWILFRSRGFVAL